MPNSTTSFTIPVNQRQHPSPAFSSTRSVHPSFRNLSQTSRYSCTTEKSWHTRFRAQCKDRLTKAREASFMANRHTLPKELSDQEMYEIIRQEWAKFKSEMERQSEFGELDEAELEAEIEAVARQEWVEQREVDEFEMYEEMMAEEMRMEEEEEALTEADLQYLIDMDIDADINMDETT
ncbi:hypothetical protein FBU59_003088 [Linderina macrospora]|uniref:Uncharacterized protein n=1 Tax=Linderina macrospora TaxID=4868 RepID=A0ACC1J9M8_9FUNG|nr:hypothetical protein FBU59_003088 [Linderina macrospora]